MTAAIGQSCREGRYTVSRILRFDNPFWPAYLIFRGEKLVGRSFSYPDAEWCESIERITKLGRYVDHLSDPKSYNYRLPKRGRPTELEQHLRRQVELLVIPD